MYIYVITFIYVPMYIWMWVAFGRCLLLSCDVEVVLMQVLLLLWPTAVGRKR